MERRSLVEEKRGLHQKQVRKKKENLGDEVAEQVT